MKLGFSEAGLRCAGMQCVRIQCAGVHCVGIQCAGVQCSGMQCTWDVVNLGCSELWMQCCIDRNPFGFQRSHPESNSHL